METKRIELLLGKEGGKREKITLVCGLGLLAMTVARFDPKQTEEAPPVPTVAPAEAPTDSTPLDTDLGGIVIDDVNANISTLPGRVAATEDLSCHFHTPDGDAFTSQGPNEGRGVVCIPRESPD